MDSFNEVSMTVGKYKKSMRKTIHVLQRQNSKREFATRVIRNSSPTDATMKQQLLMMQQHNLFADIEHRVDMIGSSALQKRGSVADDNTKPRKKPPLVRQPTFYKHAPQVTVQREAWTRLRKANQLPDFEPIACSFFCPKDYIEMDAESLEAIRKSRTKITASLNLSGDRFARLFRLRQNVFTIEKKFRSLLKNNARQEKPSERNNVNYGVHGGHRPSRFSEPWEAKKLFRKKTRILLIAMRWLNYVFTKEHTNWEAELKTFADVAVEMEQRTGHSQCYKDTGLNFDKNYYKANREISLSADVRHYLSLNPEARTPDMLQQVLHGLQTLQSLCEYPLKTQERLCKVAWYQRVEAKKVILRQGHHPESFYFILSGAAYVKKMTQDTENGDQLISTCARLTRGQSFGEVSLIFDTLRTATVESATVMELLVIGRTDFLSIFMNDGDPTQEADHIKFLKQLPVLKHWPIDMLKTEPGTCLLHYFKRGTLVTENGLKSEWLYFIKSGSCEAIKRLKAVRGRSPKQLKRHLNPLYDVILPKLSPGEEVASRLDTGASARKREQKLINREVLESMKSYYDGIRRTLSDPGPSSTEQTPATNSTSREKDGEPARNPEVPRVRFFLTQGELDERIPPTPARKPNGTPGVSVPRISKPFLVKSNTSSMFPTSTSFLQELTPRSIGDSTTYSNNNRAHQVFVKVDVLQARDIFGMQTLEAYENGETGSSTEEIPNISLVSRGAEVVLLSKKIFLKYADERVTRSVQEMATRYPRETTLQENLQIQADWDVYRQSVLEDVVTVTKAHRTRAASAVT